MRRLVVLHGAGGSASSYPGFVREARRRGYDAVAPDLPGHGADPEPLAGGAIEAAHRLIAPGAAVRAVSFGALLALHAADGAAALVALAPADERLSAERFPNWNARVDARGLRGLLGSLDTEAAVRRLACPVLYVVAADDDRVPPERVERLHAVTPRSELVVCPAGGHGGPARDPEIDALTLDWLEREAPP